MSRWLPKKNVIRVVKKLALHLHLTKDPSLSVNIEFSQVAAVKEVRKDKGKMKMY